MKKTDIIILAVVLLALVVVRSVFNIPNFNPMGAVALMGGMLAAKKLWAWVLPFAALFLGDAIMGLSSPMHAEYLFSANFFFVYASFAAIIGVGIFFRKNPSLTKVFGGSILAAVAFFLISNAGSWLLMPQYSKDVAGLMTSYEMALPFFRATLVSQLIFSCSIYLVYQLATSKKVALA